jgi:hypothetical protein
MHRYAYQHLSRITWKSYVPIVPVLSFTAWVIGLAVWAEAFSKSWDATSRAMDTVGILRLSVLDRLRSGCIAVNVSLTAALVLLVLLAFWRCWLRRQYKESDPARSMSRFLLSSSVCITVAWVLTLAFVAELGGFMVWGAGAQALQKAAMESYEVRRPRVERRSNSLAAQASAGTAAAADQPAQALTIAPPPPQALNGMIDMGTSLMSNADKLTKMLLPDADKEAQNAMQVVVELASAMLGVGASPPPARTSFEEQPRMFPPPAKPGACPFYCLDLSKRLGASVSKAKSCICEVDTLREMSVRAGEVASELLPAVAAMFVMFAAASWMTHALVGYYNRAAGEAEEQARTDAEAQAARSKPKMALPDYLLVV